MQSWIWCSLRSLHLSTVIEIWLSFVLSVVFNLTEQKSIVRMLHVTSYTLIIRINYHTDMKILLNITVTINSKIQLSNIKCVSSKHLRFILFSFGKFCRIWQYEYVMGIPKRWCEIYINIDTKIRILEYTKMILASYLVTKFFLSMCLFTRETND